MATEPVPRRFTVDEYHRMAEAGILTEDDRVELLDGQIVQMSPIGGRHSGCVARLTRLLVRGLGDEVIVHIQSPVELGPDQEPEPDVAVVRAREYGDDLPRSEDVLLLIEVADTSVRYDRMRKLPLYARAGIPEFWLVDLQRETIEQYTTPVGHAYRQVVHVGRGEEIASRALPGLVVRADDVLG